MEKKKVVLDFTTRKYSDAGVCQDNELVHQFPMVEVMKMWDRAYAAAKVNKEEDDYVIQHRHDAISVFASRGAGKTTFLLSVLDRIKQKYKDALCLDVIDPSLMESKQHAFVNIIARIQERVEEYIKKENYHSPRSKGYGKKIEFDKSYKELLNALPFVDGVGKNHAYDEWEDVEYIAIQGMEKAIASSNLQISFHRYVKAVLDLMGKDCIVIPFDDIDTDFKKGFEILEVIRKYLTTSKVIIFLTGDLELYSKLLRNAFWKHFERNYLYKETEYAKRSPEEFVSMIDQLENQYLVKVLKPENRINLKTLEEYLDEVDIWVEYGDKENVVEGDRLLEFYRRKLVEKISISAIGSIHPMGGIEHFLATLSIRIQMRILILLSELIKVNTKGAEYTYKLSSGLIDIFSNDIYQKTKNAKQLQKGGRGYVEEMLTFLINTRSLHERKNFLPESNDEVLNKALFAIGSEFNHLLKQHKYMVFDYWLRISYVQALLERIGDTEYKMTEEYLSYSLMNTDTGLGKCVGLSHAYCNWKLNQNLVMDAKIQTMPGVIFIGNNSPLLRGGVLNILSLLPMLGTMNGNQTENVFLSVYKLLGVVREMLFCCERGFLIEDFIPIVNRLAQYRNFLEPRRVQPTKNLAKERKELDDLIFDLNKSDLIDWGPIYKLFKQWERCVFGDVSLQLLDKVFTRFYFTIINLDQSHRQYNPGEKLNLCLIALLNSALVEDAMCSNFGGIELNNVGDIERIFIANVQRVKKTYYKNGWLNFYNWLRECPIFRLFINPLVYRLMLESNEGSSQDLEACLLYGRYITQEKEYKQLMQNIESERKNIEKGLEWIQKYDDWHANKEELKFLRRYRQQSVDVPNINHEQIMFFIEREQDVQKEIDKLEGDITPLEVLDGDYILSVNLDEQIIRECRKILIKKDEVNLRQSTDIQRDMDEIDRKKTQVPEGVKKYYKDIMDKEERTSLSAYHIMYNL